jgi:hypothetical protein
MRLHAARSRCTVNVAAHSARTGQDEPVDPVRPRYHCVQDNDRVGSGRDDLDDADRALGRHNAVEPRSRKQPVDHDKVLYRQRHKIIVAPRRGDGAIRAKCWDYE